METVLMQSQTWLSVAVGSAMLALGYLAAKYAVPWLKVGCRRKYAEYVALIADEVTDDLRRRYPDTAWLEHLDEAVDKLIEVCRVRPEVAQRAVNASASRK